MRYYQSMIDGDLLLAGAKYYELKPTFIIFICPFEILDGNRHIYTFRSICTEDRNLEMPDGTAKILLSTKGKMEDVAPDVQAFLDYVEGILGEDEFVREIDREIRNLKAQESEKVSYMTYEMKIQEERDEARAEGRAEGERKGRAEEQLSSIRNLMESVGWTAQQAMDALKIPAEKREVYLAQL